MGKGLTTLAVAATLATGNIQAEGNRTPDFSGLMGLDKPEVPTVITNTRTNILLAQAETGKVYVVQVIQLDGSKKEVRYTKGEGGWIIPPDTNGGPLLDGNPSTGNPKLDKAKNISILGKYDKDKQIILAMTDKGDIIKESGNIIRSFAKKIENKKNISKDEIVEAYIASYIFLQAGLENGEEMSKQRINSLDIVAKSILKLSSQETEQIKQRAKAEAITRWRTVTRSLG